MAHINTYQHINTAPSAVSSIPSRANMDFDAIITIALLGGLWETLTVLAATVSSVRNHFVKGTYNKYSRVAFKVRGAAIMMKMRLENIKIKNHICSHIDRVFPYKHNSMCNLQKISSRMYKQHMRAFNWPPLLVYDMGIGHLRSPVTLFYLVQFGVFLMKYGMDQSWAFKMTEVCVDNAIYKILRIHPNIRDRKTSYRKVVSEVFKSEYAFLFLYTFQSQRHGELNNRLKEWSSLRFIVKKCDRVTSANCLKRLPSAAKSAVAYLAFIANLRKNKQITNHSRVCYSSFRDYMEMTRSLEESMEMLEAEG